MIKDFQFQVKSIAPFKRANFSGGKMRTSRICLNKKARRSIEAARFIPTTYNPNTSAKTSGATIVASDSMMNLGVSGLSLSQVIFSFGTAPE